MINSKATGQPFWLCAGITLISSLVSATYSIAALAGQSKIDTYALYAASRSITLLLVVLGCVLLRSRSGVIALAFVMALVQSFDAVIGALSHDTLRTYGPLFTALFSFAALGLLLRRVPQP
ncbi:hypothetical protein Q0M94_28085 (plasmid) [Deinococcus radiomollis]|uniref:hypothetical protein n=1 Tax=Deinococcus radiomollis TaxID=468916 RepID=UPI003892CAE7